MGPRLLCVRTPALVLCAALTAAACSSTTGPAASLPSSTPRSSALAPTRASAAATITPALPRLLTCDNTAVLRPRRYVFACGDGNAYVKDVRWTAWTGSAALATATWVQNDCTPYCAAGHFHSYPVRLRFDRPKRTSLGELFSGWSATFPHRTPQGSHVESEPNYLPKSLPILG